jgi:pyruvate formate lyase activating enzyme
MERDATPLIPETSHPGRWWHALDDGRIQCDLCPRDCKLHEGQRGLCFVRKMENGRMVLTTVWALVGLLRRSRSRKSR